MWRACDFGGVELFSATLTEFAFQPHAHEEFFIALTEQGLCAPSYRGGRHVNGPGDLIVLNPEEAHAGGPPAGGSWTYRSLYLRPELFGKITPRFTADVITDRSIAGRLHRYCQLAALPGSSPLERESLLAAAMGLLAARHAAPPVPPRAPGAEPAAVRLAREYLEEHAAGNVTLRELAAVAGLSPFHLCRVFRAAAGMPPHAYLTQARVRRARSLLRAGMPISEVATATGFADQAHLTRQFKRLVGVTPGRYLSLGGD
jgi:AraC-like DNA-binding protein